MGGVLESCASVTSVNSHSYELSPEDSELRNQKPGMSQVALRVVAAPDAHDGCVAVPFVVGEEVAVQKLEKGGWEAVGRFSSPTSYDTVFSTEIPGQPSGPALKLDGQRFSPKRCWRAHVISDDGHGRTVEHVLLLQVATRQEHRTRENVNLAFKDASETASYAQHFNKHMMETNAGMDGTPTVKVCAPVVCQVLGSAVSFFKEGDVVTLSVHPGNDVRKFISNGSEEFLEVPQAFFHYVAWHSGGGMHLADVQGSEQDTGDLLLLDPAMLRSTRPTAGDIVNAILGSDGGKEALGPSSERFNALHPRCGQTCMSFDPQRKTAHMRKHCGISCGV